MNIYQAQGDEDLLLCQWYTHMATSGELADVVSADLHALSTFLLSWRPGGRRVLAYEVDDNGIWFAAWWEPFYAGAAFGIWVRADRRPPGGDPDGWDAFDLAITIAFRHFPVIVAMTKQEKIVRLAEYVGFQTLGAIPGLFDGHPATVLYLTQEGYDGQRRRRGHGSQQEPRGLH